MKILPGSTLIAASLTFFASIAKAQDIVRTVDVAKSAGYVSAPMLSRLPEGSQGILRSGAPALTHSANAVATFANLIGNGMTLACALGGAYLLLKMLKPMPLIGRIKYFFFGMLSICASAAIWLAMNMDQILRSASFGCGNFF